MDAIYVGVDVSKDRLDVHVRPSGEAFVVSRDGSGLEELVERLRQLSPALVAIEATGGFETIVAAAIDAVISFMRDTVPPIVTIALARASGLFRRIERRSGADTG